MITPTGNATTLAAPVTGCGHNAIRGLPVRSPDGRKLAVADKLGLFVIDLRSGHRFAKLMTGFASRDAGQGLFTATPSWRPIAPKAPREP